MGRSHQRVRVAQKGGIAEHPWLTPVIVATQEAEIRRIMVWSQPGQIVPKTLSRIYSIQKGSSQVAQMVEFLPNKCEALSSNHSSPKRWDLTLISIPAWVFWFITKLGPWIWRAEDLEVRYIGSRVSEFPIIGEVQRAVSQKVEMQRVWGNNQNAY
jgi:hypothetical protein